MSPAGHLTLSPSVGVQTRLITSTWGSYTSRRFQARRYERLMQAAWWGTYLFLCDEDLEKTCQNNFLYYDMILMTIKHIYSPNTLCKIHFIINNYITYQIKNSAVKLINRIQNKSLCLHNICVCTVYIYTVVVRIIGTMVNMIKEVSENKPALLILLFLKTSLNSSSFIELLKMGENLIMK